MDSILQPNTWCKNRVTEGLIASKAWNPGLSKFRVPNLELRNYDVSCVSYRTRTPHNLHTDLRIEMKAYAIQFSRPSGQMTEIRGILMVADVVNHNDNKKQEGCASVCGTERFTNSTSGTSAKSELTVCDEDVRGRKREEYLSWEEYFMAVACLAAQRSKDPVTQVGAVIVNPDLKIIGSGYNGMPNGCSDDVMPWGKDSDNPLETKYPFVCHAEMNAILNRNCESVKGSTIYTVLFPCNECAKLIIQAGISEVVYKRDKPDKVEIIASKKMFDITGVRCAFSL
uniref:Probable deoxycytidylate deaminase n=1 Tax=Ascaris lumbricoides TaxID=6252 RepID=A0A0M3HQW6_ASCLU